MPKKKADPETRRAQIMNRLAKNIGLPKIHRHVVLSDFKKDHSNYPKPPFLHGESGVGKTRILCAIAKQLVYDDSCEARKRDRPKKRFEFINATNLFARIRNSFNQDHRRFEVKYDEDGDIIDQGPRTELEIIEHYAKADVLFLDDLGANRSTEYVVETLYTILSNRYDNMLPTYITSNLSLEELEDKYGNRVSRRIGDMCEVVLVE